ncbi:unnamed protein product [Owenia fusiformis]|uniref:Uncharacterized protein n=1 Tax=Owenia fusiformis TaxID=6347 RepID=A0A8J1TS45_OWEFU|nr:unnamed protein product [Owenia fusiformis]
MADPQWQFIGEEDTLSKKRCQRLFAESGKDDDIALFYTEGKFYALEAWCQHQGGPLFSGDIEDLKGTSIKAVQCPWHGYKFKLEDGENTNIPGLNQKKYDVKCEEGKVYVDCTHKLSTQEVRS